MYVEILVSNALSMLVCQIKIACQISVIGIHSTITYLIFQYVVFTFSVPFIYTSIFNYDVSSYL